MVFVTIMMKFNKKVKMSNLYFLADFRGVSTETLQTREQVTLLNSQYDSMRSFAGSYRGNQFFRSRVSTNGPMNIVVLMRSSAGVKSEVLLKIQRASDKKTAGLLSGASAGR